MNRLERLLDEQHQLYKRSRLLLDLAEREDRGLTPDEQRSYDADDARLDELEGEIRRLEKQARREAIDQRGAAPRPDEDYPDAAGGRWRHTGGDHTYTEHDQSRSWARDLVAAGLRGDPDARERLRRNNREVFDGSEDRALSTIDGSAGEFVPPKWLLDEVAKMARAGRVVADQQRRMPMPEGTDSISIPRVTTGTAVAEYTVQGSEVQQTDATFDTITADITTIAGGQTLSLQSLEQSGAPIDRIVMADLMADLANKIDRFVIANNAARKLGILSVSGTNQVTYTTGSPTVAGLYAKIADAIQQVHVARFLPPTRVYCHPRRWAWMTAQSDSTGRPLVTPIAQVPQNVMAAMGPVSSEGLVGELQGLPVFTDPNLPVNLGTGLNEDRIIVQRPEDAILWESIPTAGAFPEPLASRMQVFLRLHNYVAYQAGRYPKSISVIGGTGLATPTF